MLKVFLFAALFIALAVAMPAPAEDKDAEEGDREGKALLLGSGYYGGYSGYPYYKSYYGSNYLGGMGCRFGSCYNTAYRYSYPTTAFSSRYIGSSYIPSHSLNHFGYNYLY